jgi:thiosulfate/3-mercaptopyruvate sulfurtransferase
MLNANMIRLQNNGFELTKKLFVPKPTTFIPKINQMIRMDAVQLKENLKNLTILDVRTPQEFIGGHLPHSKLFLFTEGI